MNIFILDNDPVVSAQHLCDKHVSKMLLESAQLLCNAFSKQGILAPYRSTHVNHPCSVWIRTSRSNFEWLAQHACALCDEKVHRFGSKHASESVVRWCVANACMLSFSHVDLSPFVQAMPDRFKDNDAVKAYRDYYVSEKSRFAKWNHGRAKPTWFTNR